MPLTGHYSDEDFQQFLDNRFARGRDAFEAHLRKCSRCAKQLNAYQSVFTYLQNEFGECETEFSVALEVADRIFGHTRPAAVLERGVYWLVVTLALLASAVCLYLVMHLLPSIPLLAAALILAGVLVFVSYKETAIMRQKLAALSE